MKSFTCRGWQRALAPAAVLLVGGVGVGVPSASHAAGQYDRYGNSGAVVQCESVNNRIRNCPTGGRDARMVRQMSDSPCVEGRTWGTDRNGVWVSNGCRAEFAIGGNNAGWRDGWRGRGNGWGNGRGHGAMQTIRCESTDKRPRECAADTRGGVQLTRQLSGSACVEGRDWGSSRNGVWVSNGCRAEFAVGGGGGRWGGNSGYGNDYGYGNTGGQQTIRCESKDSRQRYCDASIRRGVQIQRQLSDTRCIEGQNWGWDRRGVWVAGGCRAEFSVY